MIGPAYLDLPRCRLRLCRAAAVFPTGDGLYAKCAVCGDHRVVSEDDHQRAARAMAAWRKAERPGIWGAEQEAHEAFIQSRASAEQEKLRRLHEGRW